MNQMIRSNCLTQFTTFPDVHYSVIKWNELSSKMKSIVIVSVWDHTYKNKFKSEIVIRLSFILFLFNLTISVTIKYVLDITQFFVLWRKILQFHFFRDRCMQSEQHAYVIFYKSFISATFPELKIANAIPVFKNNQSIYEIQFIT